MMKLQNKDVTKQTIDDSVGTNTMVSWSLEKKMRELNSKQIQISVSIHISKIIVVLYLSSKGTRKVLP